MKAKPVIVKDNQYVEVAITEATHICLKFPGPIPDRVIPFSLSGARDGTSNWTWNGDTEKPTLRPSILTRIDFELNDAFVCHSWVTDGNVHFLSDCTHKLKDQVVPLLDFE